MASSAATTRALRAVAGTVRAQVGPSDPLCWMLREQDADIAEREGWMLRLLDAPAAIAARGFPATDLTVPLQITDDLRPANSGRWDLTVRAGLADGGSQDAEAALDGAFAVTPFMLDGF